MSKPAILKKPTLTTSTVLDFAEGATDIRSTPAGAKGYARAEIAPVGQKSGLVPEGDVRLTANIRGDLHLKLKIRAAQERTTVGELIEQWVEGWRS